MKIIINQPRASYYVGGAEMISFDHAINLLKLGHEIYFFTILPSSINSDYSKQYKNFYTKFNDNIKFVELKQDERALYIYNIPPGEDRSRWNIESIFYSQKLYEYINKEKSIYDLIFSYYILDSIFSSPKYIKNNFLYLCGIPKNQNDFQGSFLSVYDKIIAISEEVKESWKKYSKNDIFVVSTGVDSKRFSLDNRTYSNQIRLLFIGRIIERKNVDLIIDAYEMLKSKYNLSLTIVGDGPKLNDIKKKNTDAIFTGVVDNPESYYKNADIFITPSKHGEGLQGTILESMCSGLIVVATSTKINKKLLGNKRGVLVSPDIDSIIKGLNKAINLDRKKICKNNREYVINNYDWIVKCKEILECVK